MVRGEKTSSLIATLRPILTGPHESIHSRPSIHVPAPISTLLGVRIWTLGPSFSLPSIEAPSSRNPWTRPALPSSF